MKSRAEWDEQISEGKSLSEREEAVLQALELLTCSADEIVWVKGTDLREKIRSLLGQSSDEMDNAQWIGHILKRLQLTNRGANIMSAASSMLLSDTKCWIDAALRCTTD